jgi:hypothetical protein
MNEWIGTSERMPPDFHEVMFFYVILDDRHGTIMKKDIVCGHHENGEWRICYLYHSLKVNRLVMVTHWMELPDYPIRHWGMPDE